ncbi:MAG TPA: biosynthetic peptidoglycan transglycosylase, partial [Vicinamibacterales bacterium]|nr:biosynthetic peptidoglycan transglycosylase [Vicinamibacterales bacterium]
MPPPFPPGRPVSFANGPGARLRAWTKAHRRTTIAAGVALGLLLIYMLVGGPLAAHLIAGKASAKLGRQVTIGGGHGGLGAIVLGDVVVSGAPGQPPLVTVKEVRIPWGAALGMRGDVRVDGLRIAAVNGGPADNVSVLVERLRGRGKGKDKAEPTDGGGSSSSSVPDVVITNGALDARDETKHVALKIGSFDAELRPGTKLAVRLRGVRGVVTLGADGEGPSFAADEIDVQTPLAGLKPTGVPALRVTAGRASPLPTLSLTGITGVIAPPPAGVPGPADGLVIDLRGSYGGAKESLWTAKGRADLEKGIGKLALRAEQFSLGRIRDVLPPSVLAPENTTLDAALDLAWVGDAVKFGGELAVVGLSLHHEGLASDPIENVSLGLTLAGTAYPAARRLELEKFEGKVRDVTARLSGTIALPAGTFKFTNGRKLDVVPQIALAFTVPKVPCAKLLTSIPPALVPHLHGFEMKGTFAADVGAKIDFADLDALELTGKVGIDGCKVIKAPPEVLALDGKQPGKESIVVNVEVPKKFGAPATPDPDTLSVVIGPDNPDFVPYNEISPYLVGSIMTTEDNGFFKHRGWVSSEFKSALRRNLQRGGFRLGASSITMQMTKNVLLTREKTLSRKLQELFLVWYIEQNLSKERILELYFNAVEFGPRIYGIGAATRHYFGKKPADLTPL